MIRFSRRGLLAAGAVACVAGLAACQSQSHAASQIVSDVQLIAAGLAAAETAIAAIPGVPAAALTQIDGYLTTIQADAAKVAATLTPSAGTVQEISQVVQALASIALPLLPAGSAVEAAIQAAISLLPSILAAVGLLGAGPAPEYLPAQARLILAGFAG